MGNYLWKQKVTQINIKPPSKKILINQAFCTGCNKVVRDEGQCNCGNIKINNGIHIYENKELYSDCSLIEFN
jgi:hypothetical protein